MRKSTLVAVIFSLTVFLHWEGNVSGQQPQDKCSQVKYSTPSAKLKSYRLNRVAGEAVYSAPSIKWEMGPGIDVCVTLFNRNNRELVASVTTDTQGQFEFANITPGEYVLISVAGDLQQVNIPIQVVSTGRPGKPKRLLVHLRDNDDKRRSYVTQVTNLILRRELLAMVKQDQDIRNELIKSGVDHPNKEILERGAAIDSRNTAKMKSIIRRYKWPRAELVGWDGTEAAFLVVQHSDHAFQKVLLPLLQEEFRTGRLRGPNYAIFLDRVLVEDGRPQVYGSRAKALDEWKDGEPAFYPTEDEANVDKRRAEVGLSPLAEYRKTLRQMYHPLNSR